MKGRESFRHRNLFSRLDAFFWAIVRLGPIIAIRFPVAVIAVVLVLAVAGGYVYFFKLPVVTDRDQLLDPEIPSNLARQAYRQNFGDDRYLILVVAKLENGANGETPVSISLEERQQMKEIASEWAARLSARPDLFPKTVDRLEWNSFSQMASLYLRTDKLREVSRSLQLNTTQMEQWFLDPSLQNLLRLIDELLEKAASSGNGGRVQKAEPLTELERLLKSIRLILEDTNANPSELRERDSGILVRFLDELLFNLSDGHLDPDGYFFVSNGRVLTAFSEIVGNPDRQNQYAEALEFAQDQLDQILSTRNSGLKAGLAGFQALEYEEMAAGLRDLSRGALITLVLVSLLFMWSFQSVLRPLLASVCLCLAIGMTVLFAWLVIGHLNLIAMVFAVIMVAVGIDFAIHFTTHYEQLLASGSTPAQAVTGTIRNIGGAVWVGGITTAAAFFSACLTDFRGLSELGVIAGAGILLSVSCMCVVYPAMLYLVDSKRESSIKKSRSRIRCLQLRLPAIRRRNWAAAFLVFLCFAVILSYLNGQYYLDTNLLNLQSVKGNANRWQRLLLVTDDVATFSIASFQERAELERVREQLESSSLVRRTEALFPYREKEKLSLLTPLCEASSNFGLGLSNETDLFSSRRQAWNLRQRIRRFSGSQEAAVLLKGIEKEIAGIYVSLGESSLKDNPEILRRLEEELRLLAQEGLEMIQSYSCPTSFSVDLVPDFLRSRYLGKEGSLALFIYPAKNVWDRQELEEFIEGTRKIAPAMFGDVVSFYENGRSLIRSFLQAGVYSLSIILLLLYLWSKSLRLTLLASLPLLASVGLLLGFMKLWPHPQPWNYANFFALPILIGIGVDSGIHLVRAWQSGSENAIAGAAKAVFLSSLTTMIGFGVLATSDHLGVSSLGFVLFWGVLLCLLCSLLVLPTALWLFAGR